MSEKQIYAFTGLPGSGKSTAGEMLEEAGYENIDIGPEIVKPTVERIVDTLEEIPEKEFGESRESKYEDPREWSTQRHILELPNRYIWKKLDGTLSDVGDRVSVTGIRSAYVWDRLKEEYDAETVEVKTDLPERKRRTDSNFTDEDLKERDRREWEMGLYYTTSDASHTILNSYGYTDLADDLLNLLGETDTSEQELVEKAR